MSTPTARYEPWLLLGYTLMQQSDGWLFDSPPPFFSLNTQVEVYLRANNLPDMDLLSASDPMAVLYLKVCCLCVRF